MRVERRPLYVAVEDDTIERYFAGRCDDREAEQVRAYLSAHPRVARYHHALWGALSHADHGVTRADTLRSYDALVRRLPETSEPSLGSGVAQPAGRRRVNQGWVHAAAGPASRRVGYAAVGLVLLLAFGALWQSGSRRPGQPKNPVMASYTTQNGQRANVLLPDGSTVSLNVGSRLDVPADFATGRRVVHLSGEALFTVAHDAGTPFTVTAGRAVTRVLGTSFLVRHYAADEVTLVAVRDGRVAVNSIILPAGRQARATRDGHVSVGAADPASFTFTSGVLTLRDVPLEDAVPELNRWYDADVRLADSALRNDRIHGEFAAGSLSDLSTMLAFTLRVRAVRAGRTITLYSR